MTSMKCSIVLVLYDTDGRQDRTGTHNALDKEHDSEIFRQNLREIFPRVNGDHQTADRCQAGKDHNHPPERNAEFFGVACNLNFDHTVAENDKPQNRSGNFNRHLRSCQKDHADTDQNATEYQIVLERQTV